MFHSLRGDTCVNEKSSVSQTDYPARVPVTPQAMESLRRPGDVNISPDGQRVAFVVWEWDTDGRKRRGHIWIVETTPGSEPQPFSKGMHEASCPRWSPDSQQLAFIARIDDKDRKEKSKPQLYLMPVKGGEAKQVCAMPNGVSDLEWSPDGKRIAFLSLEGEEPETDPLVVRPQRHRRLWTIRPDYDIPEPVTPDGLTVWEYVWSPDSQSIALYYSEGSDDTDWYRGQIGLVAARGGAVRQLTHLTRQASALTWSRDGKRLAYISDEWSDPCRGGGDIFVLAVQSGKVRNLAPGIPF